MIVVLDSNILFSDFHLDRPRLRLIREQAKSGAFTLAIPEVVVLETVNLYREELENAVEKLEERAREPRERLDQLKVDMPSAPSFDIEELVNKYESDLRERITETAGKIPALPGVSELEVIKRALGRRKPFKKSAAGYRDTLIWHNVLTLAGEDEVVLISHNRGDFASDDTPEDLAEDLRDDLEGAGLSRQRVTLTGETRQFIQDHVPESAQVRHEVQELLAKTEGESFKDLAELIEEELQSYSLTFVIPGVRELGIDEVTLPYDADEDGVGIEYVEGAREIEVVDARVDGGDAVLELAGLADLTLSFFVPKWELWQLDEDSKPKAEVIERDWNEHYALVESVRSLRFEAVAGYEVEAKQFDSVEITSLADE